MWLNYPLVSSIPMATLCPHSMVKVTCLSVPWEITLMFSPHCNWPHSNCFPPAPRVVISLHIEGVWYRIVSDISQHYHLTSTCLTCTYKPSDSDSNTRALWRKREERKDSRHYRYAKSGCSPPAFPNEHSDTPGMGNRCNDTEYERNCCQVLRKIGNSSAVVQSGNITRERQISTWGQHLF